MESFFGVKHGGSAGCTKSARGRTDCCVKYGGGKRCKFENCDKSAQGSTDFCKAHGGGKRCSWGEGKREKFARGRGGLCIAHTSLILRETYRGGMLGPGLFQGLVHVSGSTFVDNTCSSSGVSVVTDSLEKPAKRQQQLIPPQVLVPLSMKARPPEQQQRSGAGGAWIWSGRRGELTAVDYSRCLVEI